MDTCIQMSCVMPDYYFNYILVCCFFDKIRPNWICCLQSCIKQQLKVNNVTVLIHDVLISFNWLYLSSPNWIWNNSKLERKVGKVNLFIYHYFFFVLPITLAGLGSLWVVNEQVKRNTHKKKTTKKPRNNKTKSKQNIRITSFHSTEKSNNDFVNSMKIFLHTNKCQILVSDLTYMTLIRKI